MTRKLASKTIERKTMPAFIKGIEGRTVTGITSTFGVVDDGGDRIFPGAYLKTISESSRRFRHLWQHGADGWDYGVTPPIAAIRSIKEVGRDALPDFIRNKWPEASGGLEVQREYLATPRGEEILAAYKAGIELEMSIGYRAVKVQYIEKDSGRVSPNHWRDLLELALLDTSDVNWGMNEATTGSKDALTRARTLIQRLKQFRLKDCDDPALQREFRLLCAHLAHKEDDDVTYTLWTYKSSDSKDSCEFCQSLDGKQVITYDGDEPFSLHIPNPLCNWPKNCQCTWEQVNGLTGPEILGYPDAIRDYLGKAAFQRGLSLFKAGARHSAADLARVNDIHQLIFDLGATNCNGVTDTGLVNSVTDGKSGESGGTPPPDYASLACLSCGCAIKFSGEGGGMPPPDDAGKTRKSGEGGGQPPPDGPYVEVVASSIVLGCPHCGARSQYRLSADSKSAKSRQGSRAERLIEPISLTPSLKRLRELELALID